MFYVVPLHLDSESIWNQGGPVSHAQVYYWIRSLLKLFENPAGDTTVREKRIKMCQGNNDIHDSLKLRTLTAASVWNEPALLTAYCHELNPVLQLQLTTYLLQR